MIPYFPVTSGNSDHNSLIKCYFNTSNLEYKKSYASFFSYTEYNLVFVSWKAYFFQKGYVGEEIIASLGFQSSLSF